MGKIKQFFNHSYVKIVIGVILTVIASTLINRKYEWTTLKEIFGYIKTSITYKINMPLLIPFILAFAIILLSLTFYKTSREKKALPKYLEYTKSKIKTLAFKTLTYKWKYLKNKEGEYYISDAWFYCPTCDCSLCKKYSKDSGTYLKCPNCSFRCSSFPTDSEKIALIQKNIKEKYLKKS